MSDTIKDGGTAFPGPSNEAGAPFQYGMSLRDWFAGMALNGSLSVKSFHAGIREKIYTPEEAAKSFYEWADLMIKARENK